MAKRPIADTEPRVQRLSDGPYRETYMGSKDLANAGLCVVSPANTQLFWLGTALITLSSVIWLFNHAPEERRPLVLDDPWGPLLYIGLGVAGLIILWDGSVLHVIGGWFFGTIVGALIAPFFGLTKKIPKK